MIRGHVNLDNEPIVRLTIGDVEVTAVIDTGFNGFVTLPASLHSSMELTWAGEVEWTLADETEVVEDMYRTPIDFDGKVILVVVSFSNSDNALIETALLRNHQLSIDFVARTVQLVRPVA